MQKYLKLKNNTKLKIRIADIKDLNFTLNLHNYNVLRKKFFSKNKVSLNEHKIWFKNKIKEKMLFICSLKYRIGYIRYDYINKNYLSVSIAIKEKYKRKGFGKQMLAKTLNKKKISNFNVIAVIKNKNLTSKKFFLDSGFKFFKKNIYVIKTSNE